MYLIIYSLDENYTWDDFELDPQEGQKETLFVESLENLSTFLFDDIKYKYGDEAIYQCLESEYIHISLGEYPAEQYYFTIHGCYKIEDSFPFCLTDTDDYKSFVEKAYRENKEYQERKEKEDEKMLIEKELKELKRLKEKYETV